MKTETLNCFIFIKLVALSIVSQIESANILALLPSVWKSHYIFGSTLLDKLSLNGHNITLITGLSSIELHPIHNPDIFNKEIIVPLITQNWIDSGLSFYIEEIRKISLLEYFTRMVYASISNVEIILGNKDVQELISNKDNKFDLIIGDIFLGDAYLGFTHRFECPLVILSATGNNKWIDEMTGNPYTASRNPSSFLPLLEEMDLYERIQNTLMNIFEKFSYNFFHIMYQEKIYQKHFKSGKDVPSLKSLMENVDLVLLNSNPLTDYPNAFLPHIIEVGGAHINQFYDQDCKLSSDIKSFLEESQADIVYISLGANFKTIDLPEEKLKELLKFIKTLESLGFRIILKWEKMEKPFNSKNMYFKFWLPQQCILAYPKVKIFITTGGSMSITEAVYNENLILGIPILPQQEKYLEKMQNQGYGVEIENYEHLNSRSMLRKIKNLITNERYAETVKAISNIFKSVPIEPMNLSTYYIELLIKEKRLPHFKPLYNQLNFIERELIDVAIILLLGIIIIIGLPSIVICFILRKTNANTNIYLDNNSHIKAGNNLPTSSFDKSTNAILNKLIKSKNFDFKNKNKFKRN